MKTKRCAHCGAVKAEKPKTLGEIAHEAYITASAGFTQWSELLPRYQSAWQIAAEAVANKLKATEGD